MVNGTAINIFRKEIIIENKNGNGNLEKLKTPVINAFPEMKIYLFIPLN